MADSTDQNEQGGLITRKRLAIGCGGLIVLFVLCAVFGVLVGDEPADTAAVATGKIAQTQPTPTPFPSTTLTSVPQGPTATTAPTGTPVPTETPAPTATPTAPPSPTSPPEPATFSGSGTNITGDFSYSGNLLVVQMEHTGSRNFAVWMKDAATGEDVELFANTIGSYSGAQAAAVGPGEYFFQVDADGQWSITASSPAALARDESGAPYELSGQGDTVTKLVMLDAGRLNVSMTHDGERNFAPIIYNASAGASSSDVSKKRGVLLENDIGPIDSTTTVQAGAGWHFVSVTADGNWTISLSQ